MAIPRSTLAQWVGTCGVQLQPLVDALREDGYETIMVNCNPETVSTDYDTSDRLYFEPVTLEDVLEIVRIEKPKGVIVQYGGQTPLKLARALEAAGVPATDALIIEGADSPYVNFLVARPDNKDSPATLIKLGSLRDPAPLLAAVCFLMIAILSYHRVFGAILISIIAVTLAGWGLDQADDRHAQHHQWHQ